MKSRSQKVAMRKPPRDFYTFLEAPPAGPGRDGIRPFLQGRRTAAIRGGGQSLRTAKPHGHHQSAL